MLYKVYCKHYTDLINYSHYIYHYKSNYISCAELINVSKVIRSPNLTLSLCFHATDIKFHSYY